MPIITYVLVLLFTVSALAADRTINQKVSHLEELERRVAKECINNPNSSKVKITVDNKSLNCPQLLVVTKRLHDEIDKEVSSLESCDLAQSQADDLAASALAAAHKAGSCPVKSEDNQCLGEFGCTMMSAVAPFAAFIGSKLENNKNACFSKGLSSAGGCLANVMKGIFDSLWGLLTAIWDVGKAAVLSVADWLGIVQKNEKATSDKLLAAQQASPGFIKQFAANPLQTISTLTSSLYNGIRDAAFESYGCEQWSGAPFVSRCLKPMSNWDCATCQQKLQVMCGVAGYAIGEIPTAILTGGLIAGGKAIAVGTMKAIKAGAEAGKFSSMASAAVKAIPKGADGLEAANRAAMALAQGSKRVLTAAEKQALKAWKAVEGSAASKAIVEAAGKVSQSVVGDVTKMALKPAAVYMDALEAGFKLGYSTVDNALASSASGSLVIEASRATSAGKSQQYQRMSSLSNEERKVEASSSLGRTLTDAEKDAVIRAHEVGIAEGRGFGTYTDEDKYRKGSILMRSGFSREEAQKLLDEGIAGAVASSTPTQYLRMQTQNSAVWADSKAQGIGKSWMSAEQAAANTKEALQSYEHAAKGFQQIARSMDGKASDYVKSAEYFAKAGKDKEAMEMLEQALKRAGNNPQLKADLEATLKKIKDLRDSESKNPLFAAQEESLNKLLARVNQSAEVKPAVAATPAAPTKPAAPAAPAAPAVPDPSKVSPRDAAYVANEYRLGTNKKPKDPSIASTFYKRASDDHFQAQIKAAAGQKNVDFFKDRNLHSAFTESLSGDGKVAMEMIEELGKHPSSQPLNAFIYEMHQGNHYVGATNQQRANMRKIIEKIQTEYKGRLFDPQRNGVRGWDSYNYPKE